MKDPRRILVVCTGNVCRSPATELLLRQGLEPVSAYVSSAGTEAVPGQAMCTTMSDHLRDLGIEPGVHRARRLDAGAVGSAELILPAPRRHLDSVVELDPSALRRTATLLEFARWSQSGGGHSLEDLLRQRGAGVMAGTSASVDILDPVGQGAATHAAVFHQLQQAVREIVPVLSASRSGADLDG